VIKDRENSQILETIAKELLSPDLNKSKIYNLYSINETPIIFILSMYIYVYMYIYI
jgi:hypothetical protein